MKEKVKAPGFPKRNPLPSKSDVLNRLQDSYPNISPQLRKAAQFILNNPNDIGVYSIHQVAMAAGVHVNTLMRLAHLLGFDGYKDFRKPFGESLRTGSQTFPDRARWLQSIAQDQNHGHLFSQIAAINIASIEQLFSSTSAAQLKSASDAIINSDKTYVLGVGTAYSLAHNFWYVTRMAFPNIVHAPEAGCLPIDDLTRIKPGDVLVTITSRPYRHDVAAAARHAKSCGATLIAITDNRTSLAALLSDHVFVVPSTSPQFYTSMVAAQAVLEALVAFMVADASQSTIGSIETFHRLRTAAGVYVDED